MEPSGDSIGNQPSTPDSSSNWFYFESVKKKKVIVKIVDGNNNVIASIFATGIRPVQDKDKNKQMTIKGDVVRFNVVHHTGSVFRVGVKIEDFAKNAMSLQDIQPKSSPSNLQSFQNVYPKKLQKQFDKMLPSQIQGKQVAINPINFGLTKDEFDQINNFYINNRQDFKSVKKPIFIGRAEHHFPRSLVYIPKGPRKGLYVLLKEHGNIKQFGIGSYNKATLAINLDTGEPKIWRSAKREGIKKSEIAANKMTSQYPDSFSSGDIVPYKGNVRDRNKSLTPEESKATKQERGVKKMGSITDLVGGGDLKSFMEKKPPPTFKERLRIGAEYMNHLHVLHVTLKLTHLDLKGENILMTIDGHPRIADFGMTQPNGQKHAFCGSPAFIAPEIWANRALKHTSVADPSADIWSSGVVLLELIGDRDTWCNGFPRAWFTSGGSLNEEELEYRVHQLKTTVYNVVIKNLKKEGIPDNEINAFLDIVDKCLVINPNFRATALDVSNQLAALQG